MSKVSIIIPVYDTEKYLAECLDSVLRQSHRALEIIIINDGSPDNSKQIINEYAKKDKRIIAINQKNTGVSKARNRGIAMASGEYVVFVDSDDVIHEDFIKNLLSDVVDYGADIVTAAVGRDHTMLNRKVEDLPRIQMTPEQTLMALYRGKLEGTRNGVQMFSLKLLCDNDLRYDESMAIGEDFDLLARAVLASKKVVVDRRRMYFYRQNDDSAMLQGFNSKHFEAIKNVERVGRQMEGEVEGLRQAVDVMMFSDAIFYGAKIFPERKEWPKEWRVIKRIVRENRRQALFDSEAKLNTRIKALIVTVFGVIIGFMMIRRLIRW